MRVSVWLYLLEQTAMTACLLMTIGLCAGLKRGHPPALLLTALGTAALSALALNAPPLLRVTALLACAVSAPLLAWPGTPRRIRPRMIACGCFLSLGTVGMMRFLQPFPLPGAVIVLLICLLLQSVPILLPRPEDVPSLATVDVRHGPHHLTLTALIDSGNLLRDAVTGLPVIVVSRRAAQRLVQLPPEGKLTYPFRLMAVRTVSGLSLMTVFHPDSVCLLMPGGWTRVETLLGVSPEGYDGFQALVPASLVRREALRESAPLSSTTGGSL